MRTYECILSVSTVYVHEICTPLRACIYIYPSAGVQVNGLCIHVCVCA